MSASAFLAARDFLLERRLDYDAACRDFRWPRMERFNWALDHFDTLARGNDRPALWIVDEAGGETRLSFADLSQRSNRVANFLRQGRQTRRSHPPDAGQHRARCGNACWRR